MKPWWKIVLAALLGLSGLTITLSIQCTFTRNVNPPLTGWCGPEIAREVSGPIVSGLPKFRIVGVQGDNDRANVRLWHYQQQVTGSVFPPEFQQTGDCTSFGLCGAFETRECVAIARGQHAKFRRVFRPYNYGYARVDVAHRRHGRGAGCSGAEVVQAALEGGMLPADSPHAPAYSGRVADQWGWNGPPDAAIAEAREFRLRTAAPVRTVEQLRDSLCNGYPCTVAGQFGTNTIRPRDGRMVATWDTEWRHQMYFDGYDGSTGRRYFHVQNSHGGSRHPKPIDDSPAGGFWVDWETGKEMVEGSRRNTFPEVFAISEFDGFPADPLDFSPIDGQLNTQNQGGHLPCDPLSLLRSPLYSASPLSCAGHACSLLPSLTSLHSRGLTCMVMRLWISPAWPAGDPCPPRLYNSTACSSISLQGQRRPRSGGSGSTPQPGADCVARYTTTGRRSRTSSGKPCRSSWSLTTACLAL